MIPAETRLIASPLHGWVNADDINPKNPTPKMSKKYKNKYNIKSNRYHGYDYSSKGIYFITICTANRIHEFGKIENNEMIFSEKGKIARNHWLEIPDKFPYITLNEFTIMPNHIHGILIIKNNNTRTITDKIQSNSNKKPPGGITKSHNPMLHNNISRVIRWFKGRVTFEIRKIDKSFTWQSNYHDRIIRNHNEWSNVERYIRLNVKNWGGK